MNVLIRLLNAQAEMTVTLDICTLLFFFQPKRDGTCTVMNFSFSYKKTYIMVLITMESTLNIFIYTGIILAQNIMRENILLS